MDLRVARSSRRGGRLFLGMSRVVLVWLIVRFGRPCHQVMNGPPWPRRPGPRPRPAASALLRCGLVGRLIGSYGPSTGHARGCQSRDSLPKSFKSVGKPVSASPCRCSLHSTCGSNRRCCTRQAVPRRSSLMRWDQHSPASKSGWVSSPPEFAVSSAFIEKTPNGYCLEIFRRLVLLLLLARTPSRVRVGVYCVRDLPSAATRGSPLGCVAVIPHHA